MDRETYKRVLMSYHALPFAQAPLPGGRCFSNHVLFCLLTPPPPLQAPIPGETTVFCAFGGAHAKGGGAIFCLWQFTAIYGYSHGLQGHWLGTRLKPPAEPLSARSIPYVLQRWYSPCLYHPRA